MPINTTSFLNTPQATDDLFTSTTTGLTEDWLFVTYLAVMANDLGGAAKTLYSIDNGTNSAGTLSPTDLLTQDIVRTEALSTDLSANGAKLWITADGKVGYDAATLSAGFKDQLQHLNAGQYLTDTFTYAIRLGNGTLSWATATVQISGVNDAPVVTGAVTSSALEDGSSVTLNALANASDVDAGATLSVTNLPGSLPPGVTYNALTHSFTLDPSNAAFQNLAAGQHATVSVNYGVSDGTSTTAASVSWDVTGTNDAPVVTGAVTGSATEAAASITLNALANATDVDTGATLSVTNLPGSLPPGVSYDASTHSFTLDPSNAAFQHLAAGQHTTVSVNYGVSDGTATTAASVSWDVVGTNDVPVISSNGGGATSAVTVNENSTVVTTVTATDDDDGATLAYSIVGGADAARFTIDAGTGALSFVSAPNSEAPTDSNSDNVYNVTVRASDGVSFDDQAIAVTVNDVNEFSVTTPSDTNAAVNAVNENAAAGTVVGVTAFATDADATNHAVTYSLVDNAGGKFAIDGNTGVVTVAGAIDREVDASLDITVRATSADGSTADKAFTIAVNDVNEFGVTAPVDGNVSANAVNENVAIGTVVGVTALASDGDATNNGVTYSLSSNPGGLFAIDATSGVVTTAAAIDREALSASVSIQVTATSADGSSAAQSFSIAVNDVNEFSVTAPTDTNATANAVDENVAIGTVVGVTAFASDADATNNGVTYSLSSNPGGLFAVDAATGVVTTAAAINREALSASVNIQVTATSADGSSAAQNFSIAINDVNEFSVTAPVDGNAAANAVDENVAVGTVVGVTAFASDADATTNHVSYSLSSNPGGLFAIDATSGVVTTAVAIDREVLNASVTIQVTATSADGSSAAQNFSIAISDLDEFDVTTPTDTNAATDAVNENVAIGTVVGVTAFASDADATNNGVTYSLSSNPAGLFAIDATSGVVTTAAAIDREALSASVTIQVTATSADGSSAAQNFSIAINDLDEFDVTTPSDTNAAADAVDENVAVGTVVGVTAFASDADATNNGVTYSLSSNPGGLFAIDATSGVVTTAAAIDREALSASVTIQVTATSADGSSAAQSFSIVINDLDEFDVTTPSDTDSSANAVNENVAVGTVVGVTAFASDADATTNQVTYSLSSNPGGLFAIDATSGVVTTAAAIDREALSASVTIQVTATSADGSSAAQNFSVAINDVNEFSVTTPADTNSSADAVDENVAVGTVVGVTAFASDADATNNSVTYSLSSNPGGLFAIDATTGVVTTAAAIDREALSASVTIQVTATSADTSTAVQTFSIAINDLDEFDVTTPADTNAAADAVNENVAVGTVVGVTAFASDADATNNGVTYSLSSNPGGLFAIDATSGVVTTAAAIDREVLSASVTIQVTATSADTSTAVQTFSIAINDLDEFDVTTPNDTNAAANAVNENVAVGTVVGVTAFASDADATTNHVSYSLSSNPGGLFAIDATSGVVTTAAAIDREVLSASVTIQVTATSADGSSAAQSFSIAINDLDEFDVTTPADTNVATDAVDENVVIGTVVGVTAFASDADATTNQVTYSLSSNPGGLFAIDATSGVVTTAAAIDREALSASVTIQVTATSADGSSAARNFSIAVNDLNEFSVTTPVDGNGVANAVNENVAIGTVVGVTAFASDADATTNHVTYSLSSNPGSLFAIDATTGVVTTAAAIDREVLSTSVSIQVTATSADSSTAVQAFSIAINDVNEFSVTTPTDTNAAANAVNENVAIGTVVGVTAFASDADATTNVVSYSLTDSAGGKFAINAGTGVVTVAGAIDREADASLNITVRSTSADGSTADQSFTIAVNDVDEFDVSTAVDTNAAANAVNENVAIGTVVGVTAFASDADATTNAVTYSLTSNPGGLFAINATTGVVTTAAAINREALGASVTIEVTATSADTSTAAQSFGIAINDLDEFDVTTPSDSNAAANAVNENVAIGTTVGITASASDADATANGVTYSLSSNPGGLFAINAATGVVTTAAAINREAVGPSVSIGVTATSADGSTSVQNFGIAINDLNEFAVTTPVDANVATNGINENVAIGTLVGITASASDADATTNAVTYSLSSNPGGLFSINAATGVVTTAAAIDREALGASVSIGVTATSADGSNAVQTFSIAINDVNEAPVSGADTVITNVVTGTAFAIPEWALLANDTDPEGSTLDVNGIASPSGGTAVHTAGSGTAGFVTFNDTAPAGGSFTYAATDGTNVGSSTTVTIVQDAAAPLNGGAANEILVGGTGADTLVGNAGNDILLGGGGGDIYQFGLADGTDTIFDSGTGGSADEIQITGSPITSLNFERVGNDLVINASSTQVTVLGQYNGNAVEQISFTGGGTAYGYSLSANNYALNLDTSSPLDGTSNEDMIAGTSSLTGETLNGGNKNDLLFGNLGDDTLNGGSGDDLLVAGGGADTLNGGAGNDVLVGGAGNDTFRFDVAPAANADTIKDFATGSDHISLVKSGVFSNLAGSAGSTTLGADFSASQTTAGTGAEHVFYDPATGNLYYDANAGSHGDAVVFATLTNTDGVTHPTIATTDFIIG